MKSLKAAKTFLVGSRAGYTFAEHPSLNHYRIEFWKTYSKRRNGQQLESARDSGTTFLEIQLVSLGDGVDVSRARGYIRQVYSLLLPRGSNQDVPQGRPGSCSILPPHTNSRPSLSFAITQYAMPFC